MAREIPEVVRAAAGLAATVLDEARKLPETLPGLPVRLIGLAMQHAMKVQQQYAGLVARGDELFTGLRGEDEPGLATFDDDEDDAQPATTGFRDSAFDRAGDAEPTSANVDLILDEEVATAQEAPDTQEILDEIAIDELVDQAPTLEETAPAVPAPAKKRAGKKAAAPKAPAAKKSAPAKKSAAEKAPAKAAKADDAAVTEDAAAVESALLEAAIAAPGTSEAAAPATADSAVPHGRGHRRRRADRRRGDAFDVLTPSGDVAAVDATVTDEGVAAPESPAPAGDSPRPSTTPRPPVTPRPPPMRARPRVAVAPAGSSANGSAGSGAQAPRSAPVDGYDSFTVAQLRGRLRGYALNTVEELIAYEQATRARAPYLTMLRNRLEKLEEQAIESSPLAPRGV